MVPRNGALCWYYLPGFDLVEYRSTNMYDAGRVKSGDTAVLTLFASEALYHPSSGAEGAIACTIGGHDPDDDGPVDVSDEYGYDAGSGRVWRVNYTVQAGETQPQLGFSVSHFEDLVGNVGAGLPVTSAVPDGAGLSLLEVDLSAPTLSSVTFSSSNTDWDTAHCRVGDTLTLSFTASETLEASLFEVTIGGVMIEATLMSEELHEYRAHYIVSTNYVGPSAIGFVISRYGDLVGNMGIPCSEATEGSSVVVYDDCANFPPSPSGGGHSGHFLLPCRGHTHTDHDHK